MKTPNFIEKKIKNQKVVNKRANLAVVIRPSLLRRMAAGFYDLLLLFGILCMAVLIASLASYYFGGQQALEDLPYAIWFKVLLVTIIVSFFVFFWRVGHTLGMLAWKMTVYRDDGYPLTFLDAFTRLIALTLTFWLGGFLWCFFRKDKKALHDLISKTSPVIPTGEIYTDKNDPYSMLNYQEPS